MLDERDARGLNPDARLSGLFAEYRAACPDPEPSAMFTPGLWEKIEARRSYAYRLKLFSRAIITAAAMLCLLMGLFLARPEPSASYLEIVTADQSHGNAADEDLVAVLYERNR
jgi:hypothetical protein